MKFHHCTIIMLFLGVPGAWSAASKPPLDQKIVTSAERGEADAQFQLARAYLHGDGVPKDVKKAFELMKAAADQGNAEAIGGLGYFYSVGISVPKDEKQAAVWFRKGAEKGSAKAQLNLAKLLLAGKENAAPEGASDKSPDKLIEEGLQWMLKAADQGLPEAELAYGNILYFGDHAVTKDYGKAARYLKKAAESGMPDAQNSFGVMLESGLGVPMDERAAREWFRKAALMGNIKAQGNLGRILGPLVEYRNTRIEAVAWLLIASSQGEVTASKSLADSAPGLKEGEFELAKQKSAELRATIRKK